MSAHGWEDMVYHGREVMAATVWSKVQTRKQREGNTRAQLDSYFFPFLFIPGYHCLEGATHIQDGSSVKLLNHPHGYTESSDTSCWQWKSTITVTSHQLRFSNSTHLEIMGGKETLGVWSLVTFYPLEFVSCKSRWLQVVPSSVQLGHQDPWLSLANHWHSTYCTCQSSRLLYLMLSSRYQLSLHD